MRTEFETAEIADFSNCRRSDATLRNIVMFSGEKKGNEGISLAFCPAGESVRMWKSMGRRFRSNAGQCSVIFISWRKSFLFLASTRALVPISYALWFPSRELRDDKTS